MNTRIIIADNDVVFRQWLRCFISSVPDMQLVGQAKDGKTTLHQVGQLTPDVVVMNTDMPDLNGIDVIHRIAERHPRIKIIALSIQPDKHLVSETFKAGASGFLLKDCFSEDIEDAVRAVIKDKTYLSIEVAALMLRDFLNRSGETEIPSFFTLTEEEQEILQLLTLGQSSRQIALNLDIDEKTVASHRRQIMTKLNIHI